MQAGYLRSRISEYDPFERDRLLITHMRTAYDTPTQDCYVCPAHCDTVHIVL
jgi:hypothetical protein